MKYKLLDLFCGAGGCSAGYSKAGFDVTGVDINPMPNYPFKFIQADALEYLEEYGHLYDCFSASCPCQAYSKTQRIMQNDHPDLIEPTRKLLKSFNKPYIIENVPEAPLINPILLCGAMFGLRTYRHRLFESNIRLIQPEHPKHTAKTAKMGRKPKPGEFMHIVGNFSGADLAREIMQIDWMTRNELKESIPPAYTYYLGNQLMEHLNENHSLA